MAELIPVDLTEPRAQLSEAYTTAPRDHSRHAFHVRGSGGGGESDHRDRAPRPERGVAPALLWEPVEDPFAPEPGQSVRCRACAHRCVIRPGRRGICGVRENRGGRLVTLVHGEVVAAHVDPVEKKPLFHFLPGSSSFSIATRGCCFRCRFCQNWEIAQAPREGLEIPSETLPPEAVVRRAQVAGARSIAYTYVEPTVFVEYAFDTARLARAVGLRNVFVTNGYETREALDLLSPVLDAANVDLKSFNDAFYRKYCGARLEPVKETLVTMRELGIWLEVTTLLIPGLNDDRAELTAMARWIHDRLGADTPWHLSRFFPAYRMGDVPPTPISTLELAAAIGQAAGLKYVYRGNLPSEAEDTDCARCGRALLRRRGFRLIENALRDGACPHCGTPLAGVWETATE